MSSWEGKMAQTTGNLAVKQTANNTALNDQRKWAQMLNQAKMAQAMNDKTAIGLAIGSILGNAWAGHLDRRHTRKIQQAADGEQSLQQTQNAQGQTGAYDTMNAIQDIVNGGAWAGNYNPQQTPQGNAALLEGLTQYAGNLANIAYDDRFKGVSPYFLA